MDHFKMNTINTCELNAFDLLNPYKNLFEEYLALQIEQLKDSSEVNELAESMAYALKSGGKRFRPLMCILYAKAFGKEKEVLRLGYAVELFHCASLIADDLPSMDDATERRGKAAVHIAFGEGKAILASYAMIAEGYKQVTKCFEEAQSSRDVLSEAICNVSDNTGIHGAVLGQFLDVYEEVSAAKKIRFTLEKKSATLFEIPFVLSHLYCYGREKLDLVKEAAKCFGMAFQLADDLDDYEEDAAKKKVLNWAVQQGKESAKYELSGYIEKFKKALKELGTYSNEFKMLCRYLESFLN